MEAEGRLYFKYGVMGSSKTAQALMSRFNYIQKGYGVLLIKPSIDNRFQDGKPEVISRIGLRADCLTFGNNESLKAIVEKQKAERAVDVIIVDESQFLTKEQVDELKLISKDTPVVCYGLLTNFKTELFEGSKRLLELADEVVNLKGSVCKCGRDATVNARLVNGKVTTTGAEILIGAEESYESMCYWCFNDKLNQNEEEKDR
ncbi:MAG: thymidine kinase [Clostridia bacterium]|nr:thymidine kinase [Clostridia bacterium]